MSVEEWYFLLFGVDEIIFKTNSKENNLAHLHLKISQFDP